MANMANFHYLPGFTNEQNDTQEPKTFEMSETSRKYLNWVEELGPELLEKAHKQTMFTQQEMDKNGISFSCKPNYEPIPIITSIQNNGSILVYTILQGPFAFKILILVINKIAPTFTKNYEQTSGNERTSYRCLINKIQEGVVSKRLALIQNKDIIGRTAVECARLKFWSMLKICPQYLTFLGFDMVLYKDSIQFFMEKCESFGQGLKELRKQKKTVDQIIKSIQILIMKMHILGVTHNDIKPANIVYKDGFKLLDFDITTYSQSKLGYKDQTPYIGTRAYMSQQMKKIEKGTIGFVDKFWNDAYALIKIKQQLKLYFKSQKKFWNQDAEKDLKDNDTESTKSYESIDLMSIMSNKQVFKAPEKGDGSEIVLKYLDHLLRENQKNCIVQEHIGHEIISSSQQEKQLQRLLNVQMNQNEVRRLLAVDNTSRIFQLSRKKLLLFEIYLDRLLVQCPNQPKTRSEQITDALVLRQSISKALEIPAESQSDYLKQLVKLVSNIATQPVDSMLKKIIKSALMLYQSIVFQIHDPSDSEKFKKLFEGIPEKYILRVMYLLQNHKEISAENLIKLQTAQAFIKSSRLQASINIASAYFKSGRIKKAINKLLEEIKSFDANEAKKLEDKSNRPLIIPKKYKSQWRVKAASYVAKYLLFVDPVESLRFCEAEEDYTPLKYKHHLRVAKSEAYRQLGFYEESAQLMKIASQQIQIYIGKSVKYYVVRQKYSQCLEILKRYDDCIGVLQQIKSKFFSPISMRLLAFCYRCQGKFALSLEALQKIIKCSSNDEMLIIDCKIEKLQTLMQEAFRLPQEEKNASLKQILQSTKKNLSQLKDNSKNYRTDKIFKCLSIIIECKYSLKQLTKDDIGQVSKVLRNGISIDSDYILNELDRLAPRDPQIFLNPLEICYQEIQRSENKAKKLFVDLRKSLAQIFIKIEQLEKAMQVFNHLFDPKNKSFVENFNFFDCASSFYKKRKYQTALCLFQLGRTRNNKQTEYWIGQCYFNLGNWTKCIEHMSNVQCSNKDHRTIILKAQSYVKIGRCLGNNIESYNKAILEIEKILSQKSSYEEYYWRYIALAKSLPDALRHFLKVQKDNQRERVAYSLLGFAKFYIQTNKLKKAIIMYKLALKQNIMLKNSDFKEFFKCCLTTSQFRIMYQYCRSNEQDRLSLEDELQKCLKDNGIKINAYILNIISGKKNPKDDKSIFILKKIKYLCLRLRGRYDSQPLLNAIEKRLGELKPRP